MPTTGAILAGSDSSENLEIRFSGGGLSGWGIAQSPQPWFHCIVTEAFATLTNVRFELQYENSLTGTGWVTIPGFDTGTIVRADLTLEKEIFNTPMPVLDELKDAHAHPAARHAHRVRRDRGQDQRRHHAVDDHQPWRDR